MKVVFYFNTSSFQLSFIEPTYYASYQRLAKFADQRRIDVRFVFGKENYQNGQFKSFWKFEEDKLTQKVSSFYPDLVIPQTREHPEFKKRLNNKTLEEVCRDKYLTAKTFAEFSKRTIIIEKNSSEEVKNFKTNLIIVKPRYGALGEDINFVKIDEFNENLYKGDYIAQEFIDSKEGISGIINQRHELRLFIFNGIIKAAYLRLPKQNSYLANIAKGAVAKQINLLEIPESVIELKNAIDNKFLNIQPRLYTIDVMFERGKPWIVELNDMPGMPDISVQPLTDNFLQAMIDLFEKASDF